MPPTPLVSVIIPTFNRPETLVRAVRAAAQQRYPSVELVVVNDGDPVVNYRSARSDVADLVRQHAGDRPWVYVHDGVNRKLAGARNEGLKAASGDLIAYCDDDDVLLPNHVAAAASAITKSDAHASFAQSLSVFQKNNNTTSKLFYNFPFTPQVLAATNLWPPCAFVHRSSDKSLWDPDVTLLEDLDAYQRLYYSGARVVDVPKVTSHYYRVIGSDSMTAVDGAAFKAAYGVIWPRWRPAWEHGEDSSAIETLQTLALAFQDGDAPEFSDGKGFDDIYERFITRLFDTYQGLAPQTSARGQSRIVE